MRRSGIEWIEYGSTTESATSVSGRPHKLQDWLDLGRMAKERMVGNMNLERKEQEGTFEEEGAIQRMMRWTGRSDFSENS